MNLKKTALLGSLTAVFGFGIYYFEFVKKEQSQAQAEISQKVLKFNSENINFLQIQIKEQIIVLQKSATGWQILEPIQDAADSTVINDFLKTVQDQKLQNIETQQPQQLKEYGLDVPDAIFTFKSNQGESEKIRIGSQKNFEGQSFALLNDEPQVKMVQPFWQLQAKHNLTHYREKRLYRDDLSQLQRIKIKSLNDSFVLEKKDQAWITQASADLDLDQNLVRKIIKDFAETTIQEYIFEGDPSEVEKKLKGLLPSPVTLDFETANNHWTASLNLNAVDKALYALTSRPTYLVSLDMSRWEKFANITLDSLRDRKSLMTFSLDGVHKFFAKIDGKEYQFSNTNQSWVLQSKQPDQFEFLPIEAEKVISDIHNLEISEFVNSEVSKQFQGNNMIILNSSSEQLVFQLNWGPLVKIKSNGLEKEVYLARTQLSKKIFGIDKQKIEDLKVDRIFKKNETAQTH